MAQTSSHMSTVAERYARSLFDLASAAHLVNTVEQSLAGFLEIVEESEDLARLVKSPVFSCSEQLKAMSALVDKITWDKVEAGKLVSNFLKVVTLHRRLFVLPDIVVAFHHLAAKARGEISAEVVSAYALSAAQEKNLKAMLQEAAGKDIRLTTTIDPTILGGLVVRLGSLQIDTSLSTKLSSLKLVLKEVG